MLKFVVSLVVLVAMASCQSTTKSEPSAAGFISEDNPSGETTIRNTEDTKPTVEPPKPELSKASAVKSKKKASGNK